MAQRTAYEDTKRFILVKADRTTEHEGGLKSVEVWWQVL